jgi:hypothetical protein
VFTKAIFCIAIIYFAFISTCLAASDDLPYKEGELLVRFTPKASGFQRTTVERSQILSALNAGTIKHSFKRVSGLTLVRLPENLKVADALPTLILLGTVTYFFLDITLKMLHYL